MDEFIRVGVDLGKGYFQIHALTATAAISRKLSRTKVRTFFARLAPCRVGMEACGSAHYWARELAAMGHEVVPPGPATYDGFSPNAAWPKPECAPAVR